MKQLVHSCGGTLVVALGDRAFVYHPIDSNDDDPLLMRRMNELEIPPPARPATRITTTNNKNRKENNDEEQVREDHETSKASVRKKNQEKKGMNEHGQHDGTIQAIAIQGDVIGVALQSKRLLLFRRRRRRLLLGQAEEGTANQKSNGHNDNQGAFIIDAQHVTEKRVTKLAFATIPLMTTNRRAEPNDDDNNKNDENEQDIVLVATDMIGDATAYEIPSLSSSSSSLVTTSPATSSTSMTKTLKRKLLLGHTASILTDLCLISFPSSLSFSPNNNNAPRQQQQQQNHQQQKPSSYLLTADRDEKIRVSHFPRCHDIYGYLLAHTSFVTSIAAVPMMTGQRVDADDHANPNSSSGRDQKVNRENTTTTTNNTSIVASTGGDGRLIIWNVATCEMIASCAIGGIGGGGGTTTNDIAVMTDNNDNTVTATNTVVPTKVIALSSSILLVICDRDTKLYGFHHQHDDTANGRPETTSPPLLLQPMAEPLFIFPAVPIDMVVICRRHDGSDDTMTRTTTITLAVLFQNAPYVRFYDCNITVPMMTTTTTTTLELTETTPADLTDALSLAIPSSSTDDNVHVPESLLEHCKDGIVLAKHAREYTECSPNDPERFPGKKDLIVQRHEKRQNKKKKTKQAA